MASSRTTTRNSNVRPSERRSTLAQVLAPEDVCPDDYVALLDEMFELPSYCWSIDSTLHRRDELVRVRMIPTQENLPLKVKSVCLPFVLAKSPNGEQRTLDLRRCRLARLEQKYAESAWKAYKKQSAVKTART